MPATTNQLVTKTRKFAVPAGIAAAAVLASAFAVHSNNVHASAVSAAPLDDQSVSALTAMDRAMEALAARVTPAIVNVAVTSRGEEQHVQMQGIDPQDLPPGFAQFFGIPFGGNGRGGHRMAPEQQPLQHGIGSGVIISPDGYIITNNHVVDGATQIKVTLHDRRVMNAKVVGVDKLTDLAVIKVDAHDLPAMSWGDSTKLEPGQTVLAFGSPFGYFQFSVTRGIVSAVNRQNPYSDDARKLGGYIQTDAAINPGNSGGALVNSHGELVGINTFIISDSGSFAGAGFAIPAQVAKATADQIIQTGGVHHGYLGISMNDVTPENAHFFNLTEATGAIVAQVSPNSPASRAGLQNGDVIQQLNGKKMINGSDLQLAIAGTTPGTRVQLGILRNGHPQTLDLTVGEYNAKDKVASNDSDDNGSPSQQGKLGLAMSDITPDIRQQLNLPDNIKGAAIASVRPGSPAEDAGLQPGDVIVQVNRKNVDSAKQAVDTVHTIPSGQDVLLARLVARRHKLPRSPSGPGLTRTRTRQ
ncbi:trypsin-like peptidase domain-containing protein [Edaphobacter aggregans]|uniref:trypsin-like peptidase domain-containing protein n=1 Tax=Edaphobacter aggregans TaxID=570835 RepID=UPI001FE1AB5E|nr:trypsin-like peptidase domain-containing protein [Edaphobacter aggregans]